MSWNGPAIAHHVDDHELGYITKLEGKKKLKTCTQEIKLLLIS
jgi:hypothetical protein